MMSKTLLHFADGWYYRGINNTNLYGPYPDSAGAETAQRELELAIEAGKRGVAPQDSPIVFRFAKNSMIQHVKSGGRYKVVQTPNIARIEDTGEPAYVYQAEDGTEWSRSQANMEDGRFIQLEDGPKVESLIQDFNHVTVMCQVGTYQIDKHTDVMLTFKHADGWELREVGTDQPDSQFLIVGANSTDPFLLKIGSKVVAVNDAGRLAFRDYLAEFSLIEHAEWNSQMNWAYHNGVDDGMATGINVGKGYAGKPEGPQVDE